MQETIENFEKDIKRLEQEIKKDEYKSYFEINEYHLNYLRTRLKELKELNK